MNENSSPNSATLSSGASAESISRRAYELWEQEGRPDGSDLRHWLQAQQELSGKASEAEPARYTDTPQARPTTSDSRPLQGARTSPPAKSREGSRSTNAPFAAEKSASNGGSAVATRRRN